MNRHKKGIEGRPTKELQVDESLLSEEDKEELHTKSFPLSIIIFIGVVVILIAICILIILLVNNGIIH